jgi:isopenicillin-N N-acyltransferase-like protein
MNGLTDIRDVLAWGGELEALGGCSAFMVQGDQTRSGKLLAGQTWDLATDNMPYVVGVERIPDAGPRTWSLTTVGCLSLIGLNEHGIAVGTTNIRTIDSRPGVTYLSMIHKALGARGLPDAIAAISSAQRAGAHFYWLICAATVAGAEGRERAFAIECTPTLVDTFELCEGTYVHTNHCMIPAHVAIEGNTPSASSHARQGRLEQLIAADSGQADLDVAKRWLADRANGENAISRKDFAGISSNGAVVVEPGSRTIHVCHGPPHECGLESAKKWIDLRASA